MWRASIARRHVGHVDSCSSSSSCARSSNISFLSCALTVRFSAASSRALADQRLQLLVLRLDLARAARFVLDAAQLDLQRRQASAGLAQLDQASLALADLAFEARLLGGQRAHRRLARALERQELVLLLRRLLEVAAHGVQLGGGTLDVGGAGEHRLDLLCAAPGARAASSSTRARSTAKRCSRARGLLDLLLQRLRAGRPARARASACSSSCASVRFEGGQLGAQAIDVGLVRRVDGRSPAPSLLPGGARRASCASRVLKRSLARPSSSS